MKRIYSCMLGAFMLLGTSDILAQVPLSGEGTETSPFVVSSAEDWNKLAQYIVDNKDAFEGKFLKLSSDIDFTGVEWKSLWANNITHFQGSRS